MFCSKGYKVSPAGKSCIFVKFNESQTHGMNKSAQRTHEDVDPMSDYQDDDHDQWSQDNVVGFQTDGQLVKNKPENAS